MVSKPPVWTVREAPCCAVLRGAARGGAGCLPGYTSASAVAGLARLATPRITRPSSQGRGRGLAWAAIAVKLVNTDTARRPYGFIRRPCWKIDNSSRRAERVTVCSLGRALLDTVRPCGAGREGARCGPRGVGARRDAVGRGAQTVSCGGGTGSAAADQLAGEATPLTAEPEPAASPLPLPPSIPSPQGGGARPLRAGNYLRPPGSPRAPLRPAARLHPLSWPEHAHC